MGIAGLGGVDHLAGTAVLGNRLCDGARAEHGWVFIHITDGQGHHLLAVVARRIGGHHGELIAGLGFVVRVAGQCDLAGLGINAEGGGIAACGQAVADAVGVHGHSLVDHLTRATVFLDSGSRSACTGAEHGCKSIDDTSHAPGRIVLVSTWNLAHFGAFDQQVLSLFAYHSRAATCGDAGEYLVQSVLHLTCTVLVGTREGRQQRAISFASAQTIAGVVLTTIGGNDGGVQHIVHAKYLANGTGGLADLPRCQRTGILRRAACCLLSLGVGDGGEYVDIQTQRGVGRGDDTHGVKVGIQILAYARRFVQVIGGDAAIDQLDDDRSLIVLDIHSHRAVVAELAGTQQGLAIGLVNIDAQIVVFECRSTHKAERDQVVHTGSSDGCRTAAATGCQQTGTTRAHARKPAHAGRILRNIGHQITFEPGQWLLQPRVGRYHTGQRFRAAMGIQHGTAVGQSRTVFG
ncbi:hypothetical protein COAQ111491_21230 [Comamonas aquatilis]